MLILVDKPIGFTSADIVRKVKKLYPKEKVGHSGTLDPMASGLLIIGVGKDTKKLYKLQQLPKEYIAEIDFSILTDTWDLDYFNFISRFKVNKEENYLVDEKGNKLIAPAIGEIKKVLEKLIPEAELPLPYFSAKRYKGQRLYELARKGIFVDLKENMKVYAFEIIDYYFPKIKIWFKVGSGTYIRSIAYWLGKQFNMGGTLTYLRRIAIGNYRL